MGTLWWAPAPLSFLLLARSRSGPHRSLSPSQSDQRQTGQAPERSGSCLEGHAFFPGESSVLARRRGPPKSSNSLQRVGTRADESSRGRTPGLSDRQDRPGGDLWEFPSSRLPREFLIRGLMNTVHTVHSHKIHWHTNALESSPQCWQSGIVFGTECMCPVVHDASSCILILEVGSDSIGRLRGLLTGTCPHHHARIRFHI